MADTAAHLVDRVFPEVPIRQWVLSLPFALRYRLAYDAHLVSNVLHIFVQAVFGSLRWRAGFLASNRKVRCGAVTFVQRFGDALNLNVHFHMLALDGIYAEDEMGCKMFSCSLVRKKGASPLGGSAVGWRILALSTYLGRVNSADTCWYLQATPQLMRGVVDAIHSVRLPRPPRRKLQAHGSRRGRNRS